MTKKIYELTNEELDNFMYSLLPIKKIEKDKFGEVFTNPQLIQKLLDLFPNKVWSNPHLKWLDPSVGAGFFMILIYQRLLKGLSKWEPNERKRSDHIIANMLFMVEINKTNCKICRNLFGEKVNLLCIDFLQDVHFPNVNLNDANLFDCIVGNPPFQDDYGLSEKGKRINGGKSKLYERIFLKAYSMLKNNGYLSFIVPDNIFAGNGSEAYKILFKNNVPFISFNPSNQSFFPGIQQYICYFILNKTHNTKPKITIVESDNTNKIKIHLEDRPVNPIRSWTNHSEKLVTKFVSNERNKVVYNRGKNLSLYKGIKYPVIYTPVKTLHTNNIDFAAGFGKKKAIVFSISTDLSFKMDYSGKFGAGPNTFYIPFETVAQGKRLETFLKSKEYKDLALATKTNRQYLKIALIEHLKLNKIMKSQMRTKKMTKNINNKTRKHK
jgi:hypothetical protein